jgi:Na+-translocating ferredoxin:NAD+ oxidoreductase RnfG subunit
MGYADLITVMITLNDDMTIASLEISDEGFAETQGLGSRVKDDAFIKQFIGKAVPLQEGDIDLIAGATLSSQAVIKAINKAADKLQK